MKSNIHAIPLPKLIAHPDNPNVMSGATFSKLVRNIERTGLYEPIVVRPHPKDKGRFQIINGHHRVKALEKLGREAADCVVWEVDDEQSAVLLATLNRLCGSDEPAKKIELLKELKERFGPAKLAKILPNTRKQIEQLTNLNLNAERCPLNAEQFAIPLVFFVTKHQQEVIERALSSFENRVSSSEMTKAQRRARALAVIAEEFLNVSGEDK